MKIKGIRTDHLNNKESEVEINCEIGLKFTKELYG